MIYDFSLQLHVSFDPQNKPVDCFRASDISRKKKAKFRGKIGRFRGIFAG